jgi:hypothetical protein
MVIIFCDINGVLNTTPADNFQQEGAIDKSLVSNLNKLILQHGAKIVLTAPWKEQPDFFSIANSLYQAELIPESILSALPKNMTKMYGIMTWLQVHETHVKNFVILDSDLKKIKNTPMSKKFVQTDSTIGLVQGILDKANQKLAS